MDTRVDPLSEIRECFEGLEGKSPREISGSEELLDLAKRFCDAWDYLIAQQGNPTQMIPDLNGQDMIHALSMSKRAIELRGKPKNS